MGESHCGCEKEKNFSTLRNRRIRAVWFVVCHFTDWLIMASETIPSTELYDKFIK
jgi:hypothetical protein